MFNALARPLAAVALGAVLFATVPAIGASAAEVPGITAGVAAPGATTTGVPAGVTLKKYVGDLKITKDGTVIDGLEIFGFVRVEAKNVTIKNSIVRGRTVSANTGLIYSTPGKAENLLVQDVELAPATPQVYLTGIYGGGFTLKRVDIHHVVDAVHIFGNDVRVLNSWLHDLSHFEHDAQQGGGPTHDDDIQIQKGSNIWIKDNVIADSHNAAMQVTQDQGKVSDLLVENNVISGGGCSLNIAEKKKGTIEKVVVRDNKMGANQYNCNLIVDKSTLAKSTIKNNERIDKKSLKVVSR